MGGDGRGGREELRGGLNPTSLGKTTARGSKRTTRHKKNHDYNNNDNHIVRGRVQVLEIGEKTNKGGYHVTLKRNKLYLIDP